MTTTIDSDFPGGRIGVVRLPERGPIELEIVQDSASDVRQWFAFRVGSQTSRERDLVLSNAGSATFPNAWPGYRVMASSDGRRWYRASTQYDGEALSIRHAPRGRSTYYAYFAMYSLDRLDRLLGHVSRSPFASIETIGRTALGRPLPVVRLGSGETTIWILARQHPGEIPASFAVDGLLRRLAAGADDTVASLLEDASLYVAPLVDLDGAALGNMRTSATGMNLNRAWDAPDPEAAPEVAALLSAMEQTGVDLFLDIHADESSPFAFSAGSEGNPSVTEEVLDAEAQLSQLLAAHTVEFVAEPYYPVDEPGEADLSCASNQVGERFGCPAITLELPIKDIGEERVPPGWSPTRARRFGSSLVDVLEGMARRAINQGT